MNNLTFGETITAEPADTAERGEAGGYQVRRAAGDAGLNRGERKQHQRAVCEE